MRKLTIAVDVDEVCANLIYAWLNRYYFHTGHNVTKGDVTEWDMGRVCPKRWGPDNKFGIYDILHEPDLYDAVDPIDGALAAVNEMRERGHRVLFVTSCVRESVDTKVEWLIRNGFLPEQHTQPDFIAATDKSLVQADVLIDDNVDNVERYPGHAILVTQPHNALLPTTRSRISGLAHALPEIERLFGVYLGSGSALHSALDESFGLPTFGHGSAFQRTLDSAQRDLDAARQLAMDHLDIGTKAPDTRIRDLLAKGFGVKPEDFPRKWKAVATLPAPEETKPNAAESHEDFDGLISGRGYKASMDDPRKPPVDLIPPTLSLGIARVLGKGAIKYARGQWMKGMSYSQVIGAIFRHALAMLAGEDVDPDTGELHLYCLGCELAFLSWYMDGPRKAEYARFDDRQFKLADPRGVGE